MIAHVPKRSFDLLLCAGAEGKSTRRRSAPRVRTEELRRGWKERLFSAAHAQGRQTLWFKPRRARWLGGRNGGVALRIMGNVVSGKGEVGIGSPPKGILGNVARWVRQDK